jgi:hypothetical protein
LESSFEGCLVWLEYWLLLDIMRVHNSPVDAKVPPRRL